MPRLAPVLARSWTHWRNLVYEMGHANRLSSAWVRRTGCHGRRVRELAGCPVQPVEGFESDGVSPAKLRAARAGSGRRRPGQSGGWIAAADPAVDPAGSSGIAAAHSAGPIA